MLKKKRLKVHALALGAGYVETSSWANIILVHRKGFNSIQEALESLRQVTVGYIQNRYHEPVAEPSNDDIDQTWQEMSYGSMQDHGDMWEHLANARWVANAPWIDQLVTKYGLCWIEKSGEMIAESTSWGEEKPRPWGNGQEANSLFYAKSHLFHIPKGTRRFRSDK